MATKSLYVLNSKAVPQRYGLSKNIQILFQSYDSYKMGSVDAVELGRLVRTSPNRRTSLAVTISKCAGILKKQPEEVKTCVDIIEMCTEILEIADRPPPAKTFPFMKLPLEIRERILHHLVATVFRTQSIVPAHKIVECTCPNVETVPMYQSPQLKVVPALLAGPLRQDFLRIFFSQKSIHFRCTCEMDWYLQKNTDLMTHVKDIKVHWCGNASDEAFRTLAKCPRLERLKLGISNSSLINLSKRATAMGRYFQTSFRKTRFSDILGLDELLELRGLESVEVVHKSPRASGSHFELERACLAALLNSHLKREKEL